MSVNLREWIGKGLSVTLSDGTHKRFIHGMVEEAEQLMVNWTHNEPHTYYRFRLVPFLNQLKYTTDCRIFQNMSALDIVKTLLHEHNITPIQDKTLSCGRDIREYCVQYNETAFDFISRLMEEEGIFYFFTYDENKHTLILADANHPFIPLNPSLIPIQQYQSDDIKNWHYIHQCFYQEKLIPSGHARADYYFLKPDLKLYTKQGNQGLYKYPGMFETVKKGEQLSKHDEQSYQWQSNVLHGSSWAFMMSAGSRFTLKDHPRTQLNQDYVVEKVDHKLTINEEEKLIYENTFTNFPLTVPYRPVLKTHKPKIHSNQTAVVTGKKGEEIWCDAYGRIKVQFYWDRYGQDDDKSSCWIRVAQLWAGTSWGGVFIPRIGQEVVVSFLDGDPDRPLIVGCVYNGTHKPPYLPSEPTKSTIKTNSSKNAKGFNELRFEDKAGQEEIYVHAQKDMNTDILNNRTTNIEHNDTLTLTQGNITVEIKQGNHSTTVNGNCSLTNTGTYTQETAKAITIKGLQGDVEMVTTLTIKAGGAIEITTPAAISLKSTALAIETTNMTIKADMLEAIGTTVIQKLICPDATIPMLNQGIPVIIPK